MPPCHITVAGLVNDAAYHAAAATAEALSAQRDGVTISVSAMWQTDWDAYVAERVLTLEGATEHNSSPIVYFNGSSYIGGLQQFVDWAADNYDFEELFEAAKYAEVAREATKAMMTSTGHQFAYVDFSTGAKSPSRVVIELFTDVCPVASENFLALCAGGYVGTLVHRVVKGGWVQMGDTSKGSSGAGGAASKAVAGDNGFFEDESFAISHAKKGIVGMASTGPHTNGSQFYVTLKNLECLDRKRVAFGQVVTGLPVIEATQDVPSLNQRPTSDVKIAAAGEFTVEMVELSTGLSTINQLKANGIDMRRPRTRVAEERKAKLAQVFRSTDEDGSGAISVKEFIKALDTPGSALAELFGVYGSGGSSNGARAHVIELFSTMDSDGSGTIDEKEFCATAEVAFGLERKRRRKMRMGAAEMGAADLRRPATKRKNTDLRRPKTKKKALEMLFAMADTSGDGAVSLNELMALMDREPAVMKESFPKHWNQIPQLFSLLDADRSGLVTLAEFLYGGMKLLQQPGRG